MGLNALATVFLAIGFLAGVVGISLMYYSVEDEQRNDGWFFKDNERADDNQARYTAGRVLSIAGLVVLGAGAVVAATRND